MLFQNQDLSSKANRLLHDRLTSLRPDLEGEKQYFKRLLEKHVRSPLQKLGSPYTHAHFQIAGSLTKNTMLTSHREFDIIITLPSDLPDFPPCSDTKDSLRKHIAEVFSDYDPFIPPQGKNVKILISDVSIDLLPTFPISIEAFLNLSAHVRDPYKGYMSLHHINFMETRGNLYQDCCRLIKYWTHGPAHRPHPSLASSWFLELVTASAFQLCPKARKHYASVFELTLRRLKNIKKRRRRRHKFIAFNDFYQLTPKLREAYIPTVTVLEPTDPADNLAIRGDQAKYLDQLVSKTRSTLQLWQTEGFDTVFQTYFARNV